ncbi:sensor domain-containing diguanylate cyclase [Pseudomonas sp. 10B1]|uniref:sensor domain-containing diguanylate cyclase n=2 Tax=Pseudomonas TaxID=286 RepID=UPI002AB5CBBF|nr:MULTISPECIES: sensor domain-containing diguanylate cyclase [unclassified Pseudomonas]MDY7559536.1 sensor domain-containing diguanylate cyclase [Pseudomonas sp. AB6]MEA9977555.1 sensor domain-containing diguanylate cyclase [Pseudomonas sp. RTS4]MEA9996390.1 sensor domain-containing diguanylate cyclase [Pseudomonas sp. AA4]MEB0088107.1 sensor domain-containing diguanylate cyclase [Pseudomonas sp. RTI1]MEB0126934.1 sensor domain-containing diguanylate cyclase [Pseudomonas sp. CCC1.2]
MSFHDDDNSVDLLQPIKRAPVLWLAVIAIFLVCVSIVTFNVWQLEHAKNHELNQAEIATSNLSKSLAQQAEDTFDEADVILVDLEERMEVDGRGPAQVSRIERLLARHVFQTHQLQGVFYFDRTGRWVISSFGIKPPDANNADREYFLFHKQNASLGPHISKAVRSRTTNDWIIPVSRRVNDKNGNFDGVVLATLNMKYFDQFFDSFNMDNKGAIFLSMTDGTVLARRPFTDDVIGTSLAKGRVFSDYLSKSTSGTAMVTSIVDNVTRLYGYRQLEKYPLVVAAAVSEESLLDEWRQNAFKSIIIIVSAVMANILFGVLLIQQIRFGLQAEAKMRIAQSSLEKLALQDSLTGLANRRHFERVLDVEFRRSERKKAPLSLIMLDIDFFKSFNDTYGHYAGDHCIVAVADTLRTCLNRAGDLAVRYGGEEMAIFLPENDAAGAFALAEKIRSAVVAKQILHADNPLGIVTVSMGCYTCVPGEQNTIGKLIQNADAALYSAKKGGRNRCVTFGGDA